jgi:hypothetical protein
MKMTPNQKNLKIAYEVNKGYFNKEYKNFLQQVVYIPYIYEDKITESYPTIEDNIFFEAKLTYSDFTRGRSALNIEWVDKERKRIYYSGMYLLDSMLKKGLVKGGVIEGEFCFKKQGTSILLMIKE